LLLDLMATMLSGGLATHQIARDPDLEKGLSQVFIALNLPALDKENLAAQVADQIIESVQTAEASEGVRYPGENVLKTRRENLEQGIPVEQSAWDELPLMSDKL
jgi:3-dehydro-L-gulonate 2-dehydrogenase